MPSGTDSQLGYVLETTYGTYVVPSSWLIFDQETLSRAQEYLTSMGLGSGQIVPRTSLHRETTRGAEGAITFKPPNTGFGKILDVLHGNVVTPVQQGTSPAYLQQHDIGESPNNSKSLTLQVGKPTVAQVEPFSVLGVVPTQVQFSCDLSGELTCELQLDGRDIVTSEALETNNPPADWVPRIFTEGTVLLNDVDLSASVLIRSFNLTIPFPRKTDRYGLGTNGLKAFPLQNDYMRPTWSLTAEFTDRSLYDHYADEDVVKLAVRFEGPDLGEGFKERIEFIAQENKVVGNTPQVGGPDILEVEAPLEIYSDGTNPPVRIEYVATDATL